LEAYVYKLRDLLDKEEWTKAATKAEFSALSAARDDASEWIGDFGESAVAKELKKKKTDLQYAFVLLCV